MSTIDRYEPLEQFLGGYFHQDWAVDYDGEDAVIAAFRDDVGPDGLADVIASIDALLGRSDSDAWRPRRIRSRIHLPVAALSGARRRGRSAVYSCGCRRSDDGIGGCEKSGLCAGRAPVGARV